MSVCECVDFCVFMYFCVCFLEALRCLFVHLFMYRTQFFTLCVVFKILQTGLPVMQRALCQGVDLEDLGAKLIDAVLSSNSDRVKQLLDSQRNAVYRGIPEDMDSGACTPSKSF